MYNSIYVGTKCPHYYIKRLVGLQMWALSAHIMVNLNTSVVEWGV